MVWEPRSGAPPGLPRPAFGSQPVPVLAGEPKVVPVMETVLLIVVVVLVVLFLLGYFGRGSIRR